MLFRLEPREKASRAPADGLALFVSCHARIRQASSTTIRLAAADGEAPEIIAQAAEAVRRYYTIALPLHAEDEDRSLGPRLVACADVDAAVADAVHRLAREHVAIEAEIAELVPLLEAVEREPSGLDAVRAAIGVLGERLRVAWDAHLGIEESVVFPAARRLLAPSELDAIRAEIGERRRTRGFAPLAG
jgi:hypothetical protein